MSEEQIFPEASLLEVKIEPGVWQVQNMRGESFVKRRFLNVIIPSLMSSYNKLEKV